MTVLHLPSPRPATILASRIEPPTEAFRSAAWIAEHVFLDGVSKEWVLRHCPREQLSRKVVRFQESRVRLWLATRQRAGAK